MLKITIKTDNEAFTESPSTEICRILRVAIDKIGDGQTSGILLDLNGNRVGRFEY